MTADLPPQNTYDDPDFFAGYRTLATLLNVLIDVGLSIERVVEPAPDEEQLGRRPDWVDERRRPFCLLVRARKT